MILDQRKQQYWGFSGRSIAAALQRIRLHDDERRAALARRVLQANGYTTDLPPARPQRHH